MKIFKSIIEECFLFVLIMSLGVFFLKEYHETYYVYSWGSVLEKAFLVDDFAFAVGKATNEKLWDNVEVKVSMHCKVGPKRELIKILPVEKARVEFPVNWNDIYDRPTIELWMGPESWEERLALFIETRLRKPEC
ncbi:MAG: hypothetical protein ACKOAD_06995 [Gammaproteobacteria bacterium]